MELSTGLAAAVLGVSPKELDNLIVRTGARPPGRRGLARALSIDTVERFAIALLIQRDLGLPSQKAMRIAAELQESRGELSLGVLGSLRFDITRLRSVLQQALAAAIEVHVDPRRGRPRVQQK